MMIEFVEGDKRRNSEFFFNYIGRRGGKVREVWVMLNLER